jgi:hypothetical protein
MSVSTKPGVITSVKATGDLVKCRFLDYDGNQTFTAGVAVVGVVDEDTKSGQMAPVVISGTAKVEAGGVLVAGNAVEVNTSGQAIVASSGVKVGYVMPGSSSAGAGEFVEIKLD